jgi:hypothetical protein
MSINGDVWTTFDKMFISPGQTFTSGFNLPPFQEGQWARICVVPIPESPSQQSTLLSEFTPRAGNLFFTIRNDDPNNVLVIRPTAIIAN